MKVILEIGIDEIWIRGLELDSMTDEELLEYFDEDILSLVENAEWIKWKIIR